MDAKYVNHNAQIYGECYVQIEADEEKVTQKQGDTRL
jgi:hypothetical protein